MNALFAVSTFYFYGRCPSDCLSGRQLALYPLPTCLFHMHAVFPVSSL